MQSQSRTVIHTTIRPPEAAYGAGEKRKKEKTIVRRKRKTPFSERLLRNTAIACALLLGVLTLRNIDQPWSRAAMAGVESALTMRVDLDKSLGKLNFVKSIMPESSLVFFNLSGAGMTEPAEGEKVHRYSRAQPWTEYACGDGAPVRCALAGTVCAVSQLDGGEWYVLVDHGGGVETLYACLNEPELDTGDALERGGEVGTVRGDCLYFEYRRDGESVEPGAEEA